MVLALPPPLTITEFLIVISSVVRVYVPEGTLTVSTCPVSLFDAWMAARRVQSPVAVLATHVVEPDVARPVSWVLFTVNVLEADVVWGRRGVLVTAGAVWPRRVLVCTWGVAAFGLVACGVT
jgi:hypothetical protein